MSYSSVFYSSLSLLNIPSCLISSFWMFFLYLIFRFRSPFTLMVVAHIYWHCQQIPSVSSKLCLAGSRTWLVIIHVTKRIYHVLNLKTWFSHPIHCSDFHCTCPWIKSPIIIHSRLFTSFIAFVLSHSLLCLSLDFDKPTQQLTLSFF